MTPSPSDADIISGSYLRGWTEAGRSDGWDDCCAVHLRVMASKTMMGEKYISSQNTCTLDAVIFHYDATPLQYPVRHRAVDWDGREDNHHYAQGGKFIARVHLQTAVCIDSFGNYLDSKGLKACIGISKATNIYLLPSLLQGGVARSNVLLT